MSDITFGTDGWRAIIAEEFTFANVRRVAQATADHWRTKRIEGVEQAVVVGYDRRFLSDQFARCTCEVFAGNGFQAILTSAPTPTPAVSWAVKSHCARGGVMITASHNPPAFNGFKVKAHFGGSAEPKECKAIEARLGKTQIRRLPFEQCLKRGRIILKDVTPAYLSALKRLVDFRLIARSRIRLVHDALFGVGAGCFDSLLTGTTCRVTTLNSIHDPYFGGLNPEPIVRNYGPSIAFLRKHPQDICVVTDGDADRVGGLDGRGVPISTHQIICLLLQHFIRRRCASGRVIKALTTTSMVDKICAKHGLVLVETAVGFKHIAAEMLKGDVLLGFEESGGIGFPGHLPERDGILAGLVLLELLAAEKISIRQLVHRLEKEFGPHRYARLDTQFPVEKREALMEFCQRSPPMRLLGSPVTETRAFDGVKFIARNGSWLMLRGSGTEPILRIYAEAASEAKAGRLLALGTRITMMV